MPRYQREYVWQSRTQGSSKPGQVDQFIQDVHSSMTDDEDRSYFIGSSIVGRQNSYRFEVIDGQQRLTTIIVLLCALKRHLTDNLRKDPSRELNDSIRYPEPSDAPESPEVFRLKIDYDQGAELLDKFFNGSDLPATTKNTPPTVANLVRAYKACLTFAKDELSSVEEATALLKHLMDDVYLVRVITPNATKALQVFETINDRGTNLDAMDLLKNLMFQKVDPKQFDALSRSWTGMVRTLRAANEKPLRFLRYYVMANHADRPVREDDLYPWFKKHEEVYATAPDRFVDRLAKAAQDFTDFAAGNEPGSTIEEPSLGHIAELSSSGRQHFILLLAASAKLPPQFFKQLCREIEATLFCFVVARESMKVLEPTFTKWSHEMPNRPSKEEFEAYLDRTLRHERQKIAGRVVAALSDVPNAKLSLKRIKYLMARLADFVDESVAKQNQHRSRFKDYLRVDLEHVLPKGDGEGAEAARNEFNEGADWPQFVWRLGNLTLMPGTGNQVNGTKPFAEKRGAYANSDAQITRLLTLTGVEHVGRDTKLSRLIGDYEAPQQWNAEALARREALLIRLAQEVWMISKR